MSSESTIEKATKEKSRAAEDAAARDDEDEEHESDEDDSDDSTDDAATRPMRPVELGSKEKVVIDRPSSLSMIWTIARREMAAYFNSVVTYIVIAASMIALGLYFYLYQGG